MPDDPTSPPAFSGAELRAMRQALDQAQNAWLVGEVPVGAVILRDDDQGRPQVIATEEAALKMRKDPSAPLTDYEAVRLVELAIAYAQQHETEQLHYLRDYFTPLMEHSPHKDVFAFLTREAVTVRP